MERSADRRDAHSVFVLSIGVGSFDDGADVEELGFVPSRMEKFRQAFERLGAVVEPSLDQTEGEIEALLRSRLVEERKPADVVVVHLIGHGRADRSGRLSFVARDSREVDVDRWVEKAQQEIERAGNRQRVVFLVDTCAAGTATGRQPLSELDGERGVWLLGASTSSSPTERGRFTGWIATALDRLRTYDFSLDEEAIKFKQFVRELIRVVKSDSARRMSLGFSVEQGDGDWPFLPNPKRAGLTPEQIRMQRRSLGYVPGEEDLRKDLGTRIAAGEEIHDALYFLDRASGRGLVSADGRRSFFSGRAAELKRYMTWQAGTGPLLTVTGAAGAGKSGLLGVIVCAADPDLRQQFRELWEHAGHELPEVPDVVALHARQRSAQQVIDTVAGMAGLTLPHDDDEDALDEHDTTSPAVTGRADPVRWTADLLRTALERERKNRLIVIDAVDESTDPQSVLQVVADLIAPREHRGEAAAPCRILLGGRHEVVDALYASEEMAEVSVCGIDLDTADPLAVEEDVCRYIARLLVTDEPYATGPASEFVGFLAKRGAQGIVRQLRPSSLWGPFLLAGLYAHYLMTLKYPPLHQANAEAASRCASADLPELLEAVLSARSEEFPALRAVLAILARSKGDGMPRTTLRRCLKTLGADGITDKQFQDTLREASPFLRTGVDAESKSLYRVFQQGLADYLRDHPVSRDPLDDAQDLDLERKLLAEILGPFMADSAEPADRWLSAEPYVLQHALGHVMASDSAEHAEALLTDPYFLVRFDPRQDHRAIDLTRSEQAAAYLRLLSASWLAHGKLRNASDRASVFAFDADRLGLREHRRLFARIAREVAFQPEEVAHTFLWAAGGQVDSSARFIESASPSVNRVAFSPDGGLLAAATSRGVQVVETETWQQVTPLLGSSIGPWIRDVAFSPDGRLLAFASNTWTRNIQLWDVQNRVLLGKPWRCQTGRVQSLAFSPDSRQLAVGGEELGASVWDITGDQPVETARLKQSEDTRSVVFSSDGRLLALGGVKGVTLWKRDGWERIPVSEERTTSVSFSADGRLLASLHESGVSLRSAETLEEVWRVQLPSEGGLDLAFSVDGSLLAVGHWASLIVLDVASGRVVSRLIERGTYTTGVAFHPSPTSMLVTGDGEGRLRLWKGVTEKRDTPQLTQFDSSNADASPDGRFIAAFDNNKQQLTLRDTATGDEIEPVTLRKGTSRPDFIFSPDSQMLVAVDYDDFLQVIRTGSVPPSRVETIHTGGHPSGSPSLIFSSDSKFFAVALQESQSDACAIKVWESGSLRLIARIPLPGRPHTFGFAGPEKLFVAIDGALAVYSCGPSELEESQV
ncbi:hypothetical protein [Streptomyces sp. NPDC058249]|uniref:hypothetical protein n=1 Tax=Streptomyces sp. NPDC058249 TaxID=3346403 RepID=UPI0036E7F1C6